MSAFKLKPSSKRFVYYFNNACSLKLYELRQQENHVIKEHVGNLFTVIYLHLMVRYMMTLLTLPFVLGNKSRLRILARPVYRRWHDLCLGNNNLNGKIIVILHRQSFAVAKPKTNYIYLRAAAHRQIGDYFS